MMLASRWDSDIFLVAIADFFTRTCLLLFWIGFHHVWAHAPSSVHLPSGPPAEAEYFPLVLCNHPLSSR
ncbi:hypothetical protein ARMSODRAFT_621758 [Armillaria solidipes]|uniref:Uncharacterized protein n=1 Tax=Armillaria solidipes TaxID=1076256 RepID=A0A2H3BFJ5_9AGAR|nr:hypothetical protein ARMSODRAFT_621758 [Armillaria solidipes]